jgi:hypothetical protein
MDHAEPGRRHGGTEVKVGSKEDLDTDYSADQWLAALYD